MRRRSLRPARRGGLRRATSRWTDSTRWFESSCSCREPSKRSRRQNEKELDLTQQIRLLVGYLATWISPNAFKGSEPLIGECFQGVRALDRWIPRVIEGVRVV